MAAVVAQLDRMDAATADMFVKLQLLDIHTAAHASHGKVENAGHRDNLVAMQEYEAELKRYRARRGLPTDELPVRDPEKPVEKKAAAEKNTDDVNEAKAKAVVHDHVNIPMGQCLACSDRQPLADLYDCPCSPDPDPHRWCEECLEHLYRSSMTDETLYPPRCCQHIFDLENIKVYLTRQLIQDFEAKKEELGDTKPVYCHLSACSIYISDDHREGTVAWCPSNHLPTCIMCKNAAHRGDCVRDTGRQQVEELAAQHRWQTCSSCNAIVELNAGCYHIS